ELAAQYLLLYTLSSRREDLKDRIDVDNRWTRVSARVRAQTSTETQAMAERVRRYIRDNHPELRANVTGKAILYTAMQENLAYSFWQALATAILPIVLVLALLFRSLKFGLLSMVPNVFPIAATFGIMGILGIPLDPGSALVADVGIGITLDDTVHYFAKYLAHRRRGAAPEEAVQEAFSE